LEYPDIRHIPFDMFRIDDPEGFPERFQVRVYA
jgi:hypothetical protein